MSWSMVELGKLVEKVSSWSPLKSDSETEFNYIDLGSVDKNKKVIDSKLVSSVVSSKAPSRARQLVQHADVLVATVRPNLNGVALVSNDFDGATASTGYCVLRAKCGELDSCYLFYWVQTNLFISDMMSNATGANYPAISDKIIKQSKIPLPLLAEQKRIAAILDKADAIHRKRQQAIKLADDFLRSVFLDMFGDPVTNPKSWDVGSFSDISILNPKAEKYDDELSVSFVPMPSVSTNSRMLDASDIRAYSDVKKGFTAFKENDVLFAKITPCMENGKAAIATQLENGIGFGSTELHVFRPLNICYGPFIYSLLHLPLFRKIAANNFSGAVGHKRVPKDFLTDFKLILPPEELIFYLLKSPITALFIL
ncbi:MAG: type I restriction endonuclease subunit S [Gammaproteobacteria bacterium]|nr:MAG: type I restriction endonuclease subunit S [Gammaproteobacteria bacterium]